ncbi:hypothetical protein DFR65_1194 [Oceanihabitans sediminis]|uniref:Lipoprotein n=1 Tax=Oceanihabitans sediminis TaxID=1812012 RepID=A0A368P2E0_9FLAO|nr:DUF6252 family protein [Oceanihabitans sediminis]RBP26031.1 hypothetical protein DFR65_1194 [Oceanihabitans sediminis]RCU56698.1 hypothetical protein DU428_12475 [Oceanihabitans sediminis]
MKKLLLLLTITLTLSCCNKDDDNNTETLPLATQTGAGTFACKVNGQNFIDTSDGYFNCFYQFTGGEYYFSISGEDQDYKNSNLPWSISLGTVHKTISQEETLQLLESTDGNASGVAFFTFSINNSESSSTNSQFTGELTITKLDFTNNIVSGTFWFDIEHPVTGETVEIREGRFDTLFTQ